MVCYIFNVVTIGNHASRPTKISYTPLKIPIPNAHNEEITIRGHFEKPILFTNK